MTTVVNNPGNGDGGVMGTILVLVVVIVLGALFFMYGLPAIRGQAPAAPQDNTKTLDINVQLPTVGGEASGQGTAQ